MNLFFVHTPLQLFVIEQMISQMPEFKNAQNILVLQEEKGVREYRSPQVAFSEVHRLHYVPFWRRDRTLYQTMEEDCAYVRKLAAQAEGEEVWCFLSDLHWFLNNRIFFDSYLKKRCHFAIYEEGMGIYMPHDFFRALLLATKNGVKAVLGRTGLFPSVRFPYLGQSMGTSHKRVERVYAFRSERAVCDEKKKCRIPHPNLPQGQLNPKRLLFLEQHYWFQTGGDEEKWGRVRNGAIAELKKFNCDEIVVKTHHITRQQETDAFIQAGFKVITDTRPAEELVGEGGFGTIVSYCSSALLNIKNFYPEAHVISIQLTAFKEAGYLSERYVGNIQNIYRQCGIDVRLN